jgi:hypothetical protein
MTESFKALGTAVLNPTDTQVYVVPAASMVIVRLIVITSSADSQHVSFTANSAALGAVPFIGGFDLNTGEWAEWDGSLTLLAAGTVLGKATTAAKVTAALYGLEIS